LSIHPTDLIAAGRFTEAIQALERDDHSRPLLAEALLQAGRRTEACLVAASCLPGDERLRDLMRLLLSRLTLTSSNTRLPVFNRSFRMLLGPPSEPSLAISNDVLTFRSNHDWAILHRATGRCSSDPRSWILLDAILGEVATCQDSQQARALLAQVLTEYPYNIDVMLQAARCFLGWGFIDPANDVVRRCEEITPDHPWVLVMRGTVAAGVGDIGRSLSCASDAFEREPMNKDHLDLLLWSLRKAGHLITDGPGYTKRYIASFREFVDKIQTAARPIRPRPLS
jgi:hypothetical protein